MRRNETIKSRFVSSSAAKRGLGLIFLCVYLLLQFLSAAEAGASSPFPVRSLVGDGLRRLAMQDVAAYYGLQQAVRASNIHWRGGHGQEAAFEVDRRQAEINGTTVHLSHAIGEHQGQPTLGEPDFRLLIDPLLRNAALPRQSIRTIVIDPGHGGKDPGTQGARYQEKEIVLQISQRLARILRDQGYRVKMTRDTDEFLALSRRSEIARETGADLFVSIHANSAADSSVQGVETFLLPPFGTPGTYTTRAVNVERPGNAFDKQNIRLAYEIQRRTVQRTRTRDRGTKHALLEVLRNLSCPGVLLEVGFLSNSEEERRLANPNYQNRVATGIAEGINAYRQAVSR